MRRGARSRRGGYPRPTRPYLHFLASGAHGGSPAGRRSRPQGHGPLSPVTDLTVDILPQPDDLTCGPTCLHAVYAFHGDPLDLSTVIAEVTPLVSGGTLAVFLGLHALGRGYAARLYTYNLDIFDPTWFGNPGVDLAERLTRRMAVRSKAKPKLAAEAYREFVELGGEVVFEELRPEVIRSNLLQGHPILTGLSATYLYGCARETERDGRLVYDDVAGEPTGHFVVVHGYDPVSDSVTVADPLYENPRGSHNYRVGILRLLGAILLGVLTYDGNLLVVRPREEARA